MGGLEPISCELMLHCTICYLAGGSFHDVWATAVISKPSFYHIVWHTIYCINRCKALAIKLPGHHDLDIVQQGFQGISWDGVLNWVSVMHCRTISKASMHVQSLAAASTST
jgi:hypothetical protein